MFQTTNVELIDKLFIYFLVVAGIIFLLVVFFVFYYLFKYRRKQTAEEPEQIHGNEKLEYSLTAVAILITGIFTYLTIDTMRKVQDIPDNPEPFVQIIGHQWWWEAQYPETGVITANEIHIPVGKKVLVQLNSDDVIHSWWVAQLGRKMDMIPGITNYVWLYADKPGEYLGTCSEFCGAQHAGMRIRVIADEERAFNSWSQQQLEPVAKLDDPLFKKGEKLFEEKTCTNCHAINGTPFTMKVGPNLTHFASRKHFLGDLKVNNEENLRAWLHDPQNVKPGAKMPNFIFSDQEVDALVEYINNLK